MSLAAVGTGLSHAAAQAAPATLAATSAAPAGATGPGPRDARAPGVGPSDTVALSAVALSAVALSAVALSLQKLDALALAVQRLGLLLDVLVQAVRPTARGEASAGEASARAASALAGLAGEVGTAAQEVGAVFAAEASSPGTVRTTGQAGNAATGAAVYARPAPPPTQSGRTHGGAVAGPDAPHSGAGRDRQGSLPAPLAPAAAGTAGEPAPRGRTAEAGTVAREVGVLPAVEGSPPDAAAGEAPASSARPPVVPLPRPEAPPTGGGRTRGGVTARPVAAPPNADRDGPSAPPAPLVPGAAPDAGGPAPDEHAAVTLLHAAAELLAAVKLRLLGAPAPNHGDPAPPYDVGTREHLERCEAQVAAAMARVVGYSGRAEGPARTRHGRVAPGAGRRDAGRHGGDPGGRASPGAVLLVRAALGAILSGAAAATIWTTAALDSAPARLACAAVVGALCAARVWRALAPRLPRGSAVTVEPREGP